MNTERIQLLVNALRSGKFTQGKGALVTDAGDRCCLGVGCQVAIDNGLNIPHNLDPTNDVLHYGHDASMMPQAVLEWYGLVGHDSALGVEVRPLDRVDDPVIAYDILLDDGGDEGDRQKATELNDDFGWTFDEIADAFERTYLL